MLDLLLESSDIGCVKEKYIMYDVACLLQRHIRVRNGYLYSLAW